MRLLKLFLLLSLRVNFSSSNNTYKHNEAQVVDDIDSDNEKSFSSVSDLEGIELWSDTSSKERLLQNRRKNNRNNRNKNNKNRNKRNKNKNKNKNKNRNRNKNRRNKKPKNKKGKNKNGNKGKSRSSNLFNHKKIDLRAARRSGGFFNKNDVCLKGNDGECPCFPDDDDYYCYTWYPWTLRKDNPRNDKKYEKCRTSKIDRCGRGEKLCPMRKPRLDRFVNRQKQDMYYYIDYDCIQCVPVEENCSLCSPGLYCHPLGRCVGPKLVGWCKRTYPEWYSIKK